MSDMDLSTAVAELHKVLGEERTLLLMGRAREVAGLSEQKATALHCLMLHLEKSQVPPDLAREIAEIRRMAAENAVHFEAVRNGIRNAIKRLEGGGSDAQVNVYGMGGRKLSFTRAIGGFQSKA